MMNELKKEFNLSDKIITINGFPCIMRGNVRDFIQQENELLQLLGAEAITWQEFERRRNKLVGEKLR